MTVSIELSPPVAIVRVNNPPVNALSHQVREGLMDAVTSLDANDAIEAIVLICDGRTFIAGADIREFGQTPKEPHLPDVIERISKSRKPWIAAIHGAALGGGCEVALGCHYRIADQQAKLGLPEVHLGLIPGAGGTVRLPKLIGTEAALSMITSGKPVSAADALKSGLIDAVSDAGSLQKFAADFAGKHLNQLPEKREISNSQGSEWWDDALQKITQKARGQLSPVAAAQTIREGLNLPEKQAFDNERECFIRLKDTQQSAALRHVFFAERQTTKIEELKDVKPLEIKNCAIIGGGTMGAGIAASMLLAGYNVTMVERDEVAASSGRDRTTALIESSHKRGLISAEQFEAMKASFKTTISYADIANADLVVEAVFEDMKIKKGVFAQLDKACRKDAILATNTSYLNINEIAEASAIPERVLGIHFFSPAHIMKLVEIIKTNTVSPTTLATGFALAKRMGKIPVLAGVCDGFIGNRILSSYRKQCDYMMEDGASPWQIDKAMREYGMAMGPFEVQDLAGLDIGWANRKRLAATRDPNERYVHIADRICELGRFGRKTGKGWYEYPEGSKDGIPDKVVDAIIEEERVKASITTRSFTDDEIRSRILNAMASEGEKILDEGIARSSADIDMVFILGYGFPRWRGGPMFASKAEN